MSTQPAPDRDEVARDAWKDYPIPGKPMPGFCIIVREDPQQHTKVLLPEEHKKKGRGIMAEARVLAVGDRFKSPRGEWIEPEVASGDRVMTQGYNQFGTHKIRPTDDVIYEFISWSQLCGVLEELPDRQVTLLEFPTLAEEEKPVLRPVNT